MSGPVLRARLAPHSATPCAAVRSIEVRLARHAGRIDVSYRIEADLDRICLPRCAAPQRADELWRHTCFEAFVMPEPGPAYSELNFSPSGEWACYGFERYRGGMSRQELVCAPDITTSSEGLAASGAGAPGAAAPGAATAAAESPGSATPAASSRGWLLRASVELGTLAGGAAARAALAAVIEEPDGRLSYWALAHPSGRPDFHHAAGFGLRI